MTSHIIAIPFSAWGHTYPAISLFVRLIKLDSNLSVTIVTDENMEKRARLECSRQLVCGDFKEDDRITIVALHTDMWQLSDVYLPHMKAAYSKIVNERSTQLVMIDLSFVPFIEFARPLAPGPIKVATFHPVMSSLLLAPPVCYFLRDGLDFFTEKVDACMEADRVDYSEACTRCCIELFDGRCIDIPGFPTISDYECYAQEPPFALPVFLMMDWIKGLKQVDIWVTSTAYAIEREGIESIAQILRNDSGLERIFAVGPFLPDLTPDAIQKEAAASKDSGLNAFLDRMIQEKGKKSVLYISFGSMFYPEQPAMVHTVLNVLLELGIPFVLVHRTEMPPLPANLRHRLELSTIAFVCEWAPQLYILSHPATGWFLSHCGLNSVLESAAVGVPIIGWPLFVDQPLLSVLVSQRFGCGIELGEVRQGFGLKYRESTGKTPKGTLEAVEAEAREVFSMAFFDENLRVQKEDGAKNLGKVLREAWNEGGEAFQDALAFLEYLHQPLENPSLTEITVSAAPPAAQHEATPEHSHELADEVERHALSLYVPASTDSYWVKALAFAGWPFRWARLDWITRFFRGSQVRG